MYNLHNEMSNHMCQMQLITHAIILDIVHERNINGLCPRCVVIKVSVYMMNE